MLFFFFFLFRIKKPARRECEPWWIRHDEAYCANVTPQSRQTSLSGKCKNHNWRLFSSSCDTLLHAGPLPRLHPVSVWRACRGHRRTPQPSAHTSVRGPRGRWGREKILNMGSKHVTAGMVMYHRLERSCCKMEVLIMCTVSLEVLTVSMCL